MSISNLYPSIAPSLSLDFSNVGALDPRITFVRTTTATYYGTETAKAEENLLIRSQELDNAGVWSLTNATVTANTEVAPDGTTTAETLTDNATSGAHICSQIITILVNTPFTFSCFLKEGTNTHAYISIRDAATAQRYFAADFNLDTGTVRTTDAGTSGTLTSSSITSVGNDWYRCVITGEVSAVGPMRAVIGVSDGTTAFNTLGAIPYIGTGTTIFLWGCQLEQRSAVTAYTPTTTQPITNYIPVLEVAAAGEARFDHNPLTFESLGLLVEEQRTNLLVRSEEFDNAAYTKTRSSIVANTIVAPSGELTGDKLVEDTSASNSHVMTASVSVTSGTTYTLTIYAKAAERNWFLVLLPSAQFGANLSAYFDLASGATGTISVGASASITPVGNGWYRCSISAAATVSGASSISVVRLATDNLEPTYTGDGFSGIFIWGAQLEVGAFPTSYIQTVAATVTRNADVASMTGTNFSSWYNQAEGSFYVNWATQVAGVARFLLAAQQQAISGNRLDIGINTSNIVNPRTVLGGSALVSLTGGTYMAGTEAKIAFALKLADYASVLNGAPPITSSTAGLLPTPDELSIGRLGVGGFLNGHLRKLAYYPARLTNAQLQALTT